MSFTNAKIITFFTLIMLLFSSNYINTYASGTEIMITDTKGGGVSDKYVEILLSKDGKVMVPIRMIFGYVSTDSAISWECSEDPAKYGERHIKLSRRSELENMGKGVVILIETGTVVYSDYEVTRDSENNIIDKKNVGVPKTDMDIAIMEPMPYNGERVFIELDAINKIATHLGFNTSLKNTNEEGENNE